MNSPQGQPNQGNESRELKIGLTVANCVLDIVEGIVSEESVVGIVSGNLSEKPEDWRGAINTYRGTLWQDAPDECEATFFRLLTGDKIIQAKKDLKTDENYYIIGTEDRWVNTGNLNGWINEKGLSFKYAEYIREKVSKLTQDRAA